MSGREEVNAALATMGFFTAAAFAACAGILHFYSVRGRGHRGVKGEGEPDSADFPEATSLPVLVNTLTGVVYLLKSIDYSSGNVAGLDISSLTYVDYVLTCPLIVLDLCILLSLDYKFVMTTGTVQTLLLAVLCSVSEAPRKYYLFAAGSICFSILMGSLITLISRSRHRVPKEAQGTLTKGLALFFWTWTMFPVLWMLGPRATNTISNEWLTVAHALLDVLCKQVYGFMMLRVRLHIEDRELRLTHGLRRLPNSMLASWRQPRWMKADDVAQLIRAREVAERAVLGAVERLQKANVQLKRTARTGVPIGSEGGTALVVADLALRRSMNLQEAIDIMYRQQLQSANLQSGYGGGGSLVLAPSGGLATACPGQARAFSPSGAPTLCVPARPAGARWSALPSMTGRDRAPQVRRSMEESAASLPEVQGLPGRGPAREMRGADSARHGGWARSTLRDIDTGAGETSSGESEGGSSHVSLGSEGSDGGDVRIDDTEEDGSSPEEKAGERRASARAGVDEEDDGPLVASDLVVAWDSSARRCDAGTADALVSLDSAAPRGTPGRARREWRHIDEVQGQLCVAPPRSPPCVRSATSLPPLARLGNRGGACASGIAAVPKGMQAQATTWGRAATQISRKAQS